ncbi:MAG: DUF3820 family protein [Candidatus Omnitrophica bacterium]|nr:DUF3820 family protein [Candidatus Omnitrophota bacterium]
MNFDKAYLIKLVKMRMPFGKYKGRLLIDLPEDYVMWLSRKGFANDSLGKMLATMYEIQLNGLDDLLKPLR